jgi:hypothetical protein
MRLTFAPLVGLALGLALVAEGVGVLTPPTAPARPDEIAAPTPSGTPPALVSATAPTAIASASAPSSATLGAGWRIQVARVGIDLPLLDGDPDRDVVRQRTPDAAAYRLAGSALPGMPGNTYVYGHARWAQFIGLWYVRLDDLVAISGPGTTLYYRVTEIHPKVAIEDLTYLLPTDGERLTLQTSTGPNATDPRFVVVALPAR